MKRRTNITINESIYAKAQELMRLDHFDDFSGFIEQLIRDEWARKHARGPARPIGDEFTKLQHDIAATMAGVRLNEGECITPEQVATALTVPAVVVANADGTGVSYSAKPGRKRAKKPQSPQS